MSGEELLYALKGAPAVAQAPWKALKTSEGDVGNRYMEYNSNFFVSGSPKSPLEFEIARRRRLKPTAARTFTVSVRFKEPPPHLRADAWRIRLNVAKGKELLPARARECSASAPARARARSTPARCTSPAPAEQCTARESHTSMSPAPSGATWTAPRADAQRARK